MEHHRPELTLHPYLEWATERVLAQIDAREAWPYMLPCNRDRWEVILASFVSTLDALR